jgi:hypothetical protein
MAASDESTERARRGATKIAWVAFGVNLASMAAFGFIGFWIGFMSLLALIAPGLAPHIGFMGNDIAPSGVLRILVGVSWLANPMILVGMYMLGIGARRHAAVTGVLAILLALCACQVAWIIPGYYLWLGSMGIVFMAGYGRIHRLWRSNPRPRQKSIGCLSAMTWRIEARCWCGLTDTVLAGSAHRFTKSEIAIIASQMKPTAVIGRPTTKQYVAILTFHSAPPPSPMPNPPNQSRKPMGIRLNAARTDFRGQRPFSGTGGRGGSGRPVQSGSCIRVLG